MDRHYSTLELTKHDETARAPERDYDATAFELDSSALAPEAVPDTMPEVHYDDSLPEAHGMAKPTEEYPHVTKLAPKWPWIVLGLILAAAIAIGVSVGIWHHREHSLHKPPEISSPPAPSNSKITPQNILNDTSLAALMLSNGDRQLFFQDNTGLIRRALRSVSNGQWITSPNLNASANASSEINSNPKKYTPLTATGPTSELNNLLSLYYVSENHTVSSNILEDDSWFPNPYFGPDTGNYSTAVDTRSLSIIQFPGANGSFFPNPNVTSITNIALLYYESPNGNVSALLNRAIQGPGSKGDINMLVQWIDITSQESKALPHEFRNAPGFNYSSSLGPEVEENATFSYTLYETDPITIFSTPFSSDGTSGSALFYSPSNPLLNAASSLAGGSILDTSYTIGTSGPGNFSTEDSVSTSGNFHSIHQSDIAAFGAEAHCIWINGTQPVLITFSGNGIPMLPSNKFPFTRLASLTSSDGLTTYLYHQMNDTTFAEEEWDDTVQAWSRTDYISLSDS